MAEISNRAWWLPIIEERVRQATINEARELKASYQDVRTVDTGTKQRLANLINEGKIDVDLLQASLQSTVVDSFNTDSAELDSQEGLPDIPDDANEAQSSLDASLTTPSKKQLKNQRKKDRKRGKWLTAEPPQGSVAEDPSITEHDSSSISTKPDHSKDPTNTKSNASGNSAELEHARDLINTEPISLDSSTAQERLEGPGIAKTDILALLSNTEDHHLGDSAIAKPEASPTEGQHDSTQKVNTFKTTQSTRDESEDVNTLNTSLATKISSDDTLRNITGIQSDSLVASTRSEGIILPHSDSTTKDTIKTKAEGFVTAVGLDISRHISSPRIALSTPTRSWIVPENTDPGSKGSASPTNTESFLESRINPAHSVQLAAPEDTSGNLSSAQPDVSDESTGPSNAFRNLLIEDDDLASRRGPGDAFKDATSAKIEDLDSLAEFHNFDHQGEISSTSGLSDSFKSDDKPTPKSDSTASEVITSRDALTKNESPSATPQIFLALEDANSSSIATPNITSSTRSTEVSEIPSQVNTYAVGNPVAAISRIDHNTNIDESTQRGVANFTESTTDSSISSHPTGSTIAPINIPIRVTMERSPDEVIGGTAHNIDNSSEQSLSGSSEETSEGSAEELHEDDYDPDLQDVASEPVSGVMGLKWAYATHTPIDNILLARGLWLYEKPVDQFRFQPYVWRRQGLGIEQAPVVVDTLGDTDTTPKAEFDNQALHVNTHTAPWVDVRAEYVHPDALIPTKLVEYQAVESMGLNVWRHDRNLLDCRMLNCHAKVADHNPESIICLGCGPKTIIRYCSTAHMVADLKEHWRECGHGDLVIKRVVDHTTTPARFGRLCPAIRDSQNIKSYALYRQGLYTMLNHGRYTLFNWETEEPTVLVWTNEDVHKEEMERRVERLLNFALFDQRNKAMVGFLFRLLRQCLQLKNSWSVGTQYALEKQFGEEFGLDVSKVVEDRVCECEWVGEGLAEALHLPACRRLYRGFGRAFHASGMRGYLEMYEVRYWILRAWQQQHAAARHWSDRVAGEGFEGEVEGTSPVLGPGWTGWGADENDMRL